MKAPRKGVALRRQPPFIVVSLMLIGALTKLLIFANSYNGRTADALLFGPTADLTLFRVVQTFLLSALFFAVLVWRSVVSQTMKLQKAAGGENKDYYKMTFFSIVVFVILVPTCALGNIFNSNILLLISQQGLNVIFLLLVFAGKVYI